jgi:hypothetical protein
MLKLLYIAIFYNFLFYYFIIFKLIIFIIYSLMTTTTIHNNDKFANILFDDQIDYNNEVHYNI